MATSTPRSAAPRRQGTAREPGRPPASSRSTSAAQKISPAAVDQILQSHPSVEDALSFAVPDEKYGEGIQAAVVLRPGHTLTEDGLKDYSRARLSAFEVPQRIFFLGHLPRTEKGAGDRRQLAALLEAREKP